MSARGRIVVAMPGPPDPFGNAAARWYYVLVKGLAERGYRVSCWSGGAEVTGEERARRYLSGLQVDLHVCPVHTGARSLGGKLRTLRRPFSYFISDALSAGLDADIARGYDILHLEQLWCGYLGLERPRALLSVHHLELLDLASSGFRSWTFYKAKRLAWLAEKRLLRRFRNIRVTTPRLAGAVQAVAGQSRLYTVPIAIDPALYPMLDDPSAPVVGLIATMTWEPGQNAAMRLLTSVWPRIHARAPEARLLVAGWGARKALHRFVDEPGVTIVEDLADPLDFYRQCSVLAYPLLRGSGMKVKVLETMALGVPVVTTTEGIEGVDADRGTHAFVEDDDDTFAERVVQLLRDPSLRRDMRKAARALIEDRYSPWATVPLIEAAYEDIGKRS